MNYNYCCGGLDLSNTFEGKQLYTTMEVKNVADKKKLTTDKGVRVRRIMNSGPKHVTGHVIAYSSSMWDKHGWGGGGERGTHRVEGPLHVLEPLLDFLELQKHRWGAIKHLEVIETPVQELCRAALAEVLPQAHDRLTLPALTASSTRRRAGRRLSRQESPTEWAFARNVLVKTEQAVRGKAKLSATPKNRMRLRRLRRWGTGNGSAKSPGCDVTRRCREEGRWCSFTTCPCYDMK